MKITRVSLKPLHKIAQLKRLKACNCVDSTLEENMFTLTFQLDNADANEVLQDLTIIFEKHIPKVYISEPYYFNNAEREV